MTHLSLSSTDSRVRLSKHKSEYAISQLKELQSLSSYMRNIPDPVQCMYRHSHDSVYPGGPVVLESLP